MRDKTVCVSLGDFTRAHGWRAFRVRTVSSTYHVAIGDSGGERLAILRGYSVGAGRLVDVQDSAPTIGDERLFDVAPNEWVGKALSFGTTTTSAVVEATPEPDAAIVTAVTAALTLASRPAQPANERAPYPQDWIERVEIAAECLRHVYRRPGLLSDIARNETLLARLNVALGECVLLVRAIAGATGANGA